MLTFQCHNCGQKIKVAEMLAGKGMRCPKCRQVVRVPHEAPHLGQHEPAHVIPQHAAEQPAGPTLGDLADRHIYRPATSTQEGDELQFQPLVPPPLRKPSMAPTGTELPLGATQGGTSPADDADEFKLQPLEPPPMRKKGPVPLPRQDAVAAEILEMENLDDDAGIARSAQQSEFPASSPPPLKKTPPPLPKKSP